MKLLYSAFFVLTSVITYSQCQVVLQPGPAEGKDNRIFELPCNSSYAQSNGYCDTINWGNHPEIGTGVWTFMGTQGTLKGLLEFNLDSLANAGCTAISATLVLNPTGEAYQYNCGQGSTAVPCIDNSFTVSRCTQFWDEHTSSGVNQPTFASTVPGQDYVVVPNQPVDFAAFNIDITDMVNFWLANPSQNFGMIMQSIQTNHYQRTYGASSDHPDAWRRPKLILELNCLNSCNNTISGTVYDDFSGDCNQDPGEDGLEGWIVEILPGPTYAVTDSNGYYEANVGSSLYTVSQLIPNNFLWDSVCPLPYMYTVDLTPGIDTSGIDFAVNADNYCADLMVDIGANFLRPCHTEVFYVEYCNNGNLDETDVYIDIEFDSQLTPTLSSLPWTSVNGNTYTFWIGNLDAGDCGLFSIDVLVDCSAQIGDVECVTASIFPPSTCTEPEDPAWDKSSVMVTGACQDSLACFTIFNTGDAGNGDMQTASEYRIYENGVLVFVGTFQLAGQTDTVICWPGNGNTIQLQADQVPGHPGNSQPNDIVEHCGSGGGTGCYQCVVSQPHDDADPYTETECLEVIYSYDPNDKNAVPFGYDTEHYIGANDLIEYKIRFQNTGTDTAFKVVIVDTIDISVLDITTVQSGVSSHPYTFQMQGSNILKWIFDPIALVDSATNEDESMGFVKFKIEQQPGNTPGTLIENFVDIYFDLNAPVRTNTSFHTIEGEVEPSSTPYYHSPTVELSVYPNPANDNVTFELKNIDDGDYSIALYDVQGRIVNTYIFNGSKTSIDVSDIDPGIYIYQVLSSDQMMVSGKLTVNR